MKGIINMGLVPIILKNIKRNIRRSILTILGLIVSLFLFTSLSAIVRTLDKIVEDAGSDIVLMIQDKTQASHAKSKLPESYIKRITSLPHVSVVSPILFSMATYKTSQDVLMLAGVEATTIQEIKFGGISIDDQAFSSFMKDKRAALVGEEIARMYNLKVNDMVWFLDMKGNKMNFVIKGEISSQNFVVVHLDYLQKITQQEGIVTNIFLNVDRLSSAPMVASEIDSIFDNYPVNTMTQTWKTFMKTMVTQMNSIKKGMTLIALVIVIATMLGTINSIAMSVRERTREIGILRTLGFRKVHILKLILGESLLISTIGGVIGSLLSYILIISLSVKLPVNMGPIRGGVILDTGIIISAIGISIMIGFIGGILPGYSASRLKIVETLREVG